MKLVAKLAVWTVVVLLTLSDVSAQQLKQATTTKGCARPLLPENRALIDSIQEYLNYVGDYEIPVIAMQTVGDTTHYYVTAFLATFSIKQNPPSALITVNNREALLYLGTGSLAQTAPACYNFIMNKYSRLLQADKINRKEGRPPSSENNGFTYDPIKGDVYITKDSRIGTKHARKIPFIKYD